MVAEEGSDWITLAVARFGEQLICVDSMHVARAVRRPERLMLLPRRSGAIEGLLPYEGCMVPVVRLDHWFGGGTTPAPLGGESLVLVLLDRQQLIGIAVDAVAGTRRVRQSDVLRVHHDESGEELFQSAVPAGVGMPALCVLEPQRLMRLAGVWCASAGLDAALAATDMATDGSDAKGAAIGEAYATFRIGDTRIGLRAVDIAELMPTPSLRSLLPPGSGSRGICHWRGRVVPIVDIDGPMQAQRADSTAPWVCMLRQGELTLGVMVDEVLEMLRLDVSKMRPVSTHADSIVTGAMVSRQGTLQLLDVGRLMQRFPESALSAPDPDGRLEEADGFDQLASSAYMMFDAGTPFVSPIRAVQEVLGMPEPVQTRIEAGLPATVEWRNQAVPVVDLRKSLARPTPASPKQLVVLARGSKHVAVAIEGVRELIPMRTATRSKLASFEMLTVGEGQGRSSYELLDLAKFLQADTTI